MKVETEEETFNWKFLHRDEDGNYRYGMMERGVPLMEFVYAVEDDRLLIYVEGYMYVLVREKPSVV